MASPFITIEKGQFIEAWVIPGPMQGKVQDISDDHIVIRQSNPTTGRWWDVKVRISAIIAYHVWKEQKEDATD